MPRKKTKTTTTKPALTESQRIEAREHLKDAIFHLAECWDSLRAAEDVLDNAEIETDHISGIASSIGPPAEAYHLADEDLDQILDERRAVAECWNERND